MLFCITTPMSEILLLTMIRGLQSLMCDKVSISSYQAAGHIGRMQMSWSESGANGQPYATIRLRDAKRMNRL